MDCTPLVRAAAITSSRVNAHALHDLELPFAILEQSERRSIHNGAQARKFRFDAGHAPMHQADGKNRRRTVRDGAIFADSAENNDPTNQERQSQTQKE